MREVKDEQRHGADVVDEEGGRELREGGPHEDLWGQQAGESDFVSDFGRELGRSDGDSFGVK